MHDLVDDFKKGFVFVIFCCTTSETVQAHKKLSNVYDQCQNLLLTRILNLSWYFFFVEKDKKRVFFNGIMKLLER